MAKKIVFVGVYIVIFIASLMFGHTLRSYAAPAKCSSAITTEEFMRAISHDLEYLAKVEGVRTSVRYSGHIVEMKFHGYSGDTIRLNTGDEELNINGSTVYIDLRSKDAVVYGTEYGSTRFAERHGTLKEWFNM